LALLLAFIGRLIRLFLAKLIFEVIKQTGGNFALHLR
jgi:hypothetical protein